MDLSHIMLLEVVETVGPYSSEKVILFNQNKVTEKEALHAVKADEYNENVLVMTKRQWISLFRDGRE